MAIEHVNTIDERIRYIKKCIKSPPPPVAKAAVSVLLLCIYCFIAPPIVCGGSVLVFALVCKLFDTLTVSLKVVFENDEVFA